MPPIYSINRSINRAIEFKGFKAQYITYLALGMVLLLLLFAVLHLAHVPWYLCLGIILPAGGALIVIVKRASNRFGEHGLLKHGAARRLPDAVQSRSRKIFVQLKQSPGEKA